MASLMEELAAENPRRAVQCRVCQFLQQLPADQRAEWVAALATDVKIISHEAVHRYLVKHGVTNIPADGVRTHRARHHD